MHRDIIKQWRREAPAPRHINLAGFIAGATAAMWLALWIWYLNT